MTADRFHRFLWSRSRNNQPTLSIYPPLLPHSNTLEMRFRESWNELDILPSILVLFLRAFVPCVYSLSLSFSLYLRTRIRIIFGARCILRFLLKWLSFVFCLLQFNISFEQRFMYIYIYVRIVLESFLFVIFPYFFFLKQSSSAKQYTLLERLCARSS